MEASFIKNLRRSPRVVASCDVHVSSPSGLFSAQTEDVSAQGCRIIVPRSLPEGAALRIALRHAGLTRHLRVPAKVTWAARNAPWKLGLSFDPSTYEPSARWFSQLLRSLGLPRTLGVPELIPVSATVYLGAPPLVPADFGQEELALLRAIREGATVADLLARFHERRPAVERGIFSLLAQRAITFSRREAVHPTLWRACLTLQRDRLPPELERAASGAGDVGSLTRVLEP